MTERELRKLSRVDLLKMLLAQSRENKELREQLEAAEAKLEQRKITIEKAGSIAEASLQLNGVFEAAQEACRQYTENIRERSFRQEQICAQMEQDTRIRCEQAEQDTKIKCNKLEQDTKSRCTQMEQAAKEKCEQMIAKAQQQSELCWEELYCKVKAAEAIDTI